MLNKRLFVFMPKHVTYKYLKTQYAKGKRLVVARYGDGEYFIIQGKKKKIAKQNVTDELIISLRNSITVEGQLICFPAKIKVDSINLYEMENIKFSDIISRYMIQITDHSLYGQGQWRMIDLIRFKSEFISNFFLDKTLIVTGHKKDADYTFRNMNNIEVYETPIVDAFSEYKMINKELISNCCKYKNIIFACGPLSKILIADLTNKCNSNLIDLGSVFGIIINPFSSDIPAVRKWSGFGKKGDKKTVEKCSIDFFKTLTLRRKGIYGGNPTRKIRKL